MLLIALTGSLATGKSTTARILTAPPHSLPLIDADVIAREVVEPGARAYNAIVKAFGPTTPDLLLPSSPSPTSSSPPSSNTPSDDSKPEPEQQEPESPQSWWAWLLGRFLWPWRRPPKQQQQLRPLNRAALGRRVFASGSEKDLNKLNSIVHPAVRLAMLRRLASLYWQGRHWAVVVDVPLLYESGLDIFAGMVLCVAANEGTQMRRLRGRNPELSEKEARERVGSQMGVGEKVERTEARGKGGGKVVWNEAGEEDLREEVGRVVKGWRREEEGKCWGGGLMRGAWAVLEGWWGRRTWERKKGRKGE
ncbi:MAG: hypothetical protein LQ342_006455 [Letrouitia transgressa]|nr:MAG: hypothetical protein LQ342_006455 [Letrouitia transgressa]